MICTRFQNAWATRKKHNAKSSKYKGVTQITQQDIDNANRRQAISDHFRKQYEDALALTEQVLGAGWKPTGQHHLIAHTEADRCRRSGERPVPAATVYTAERNGERRHFMLIDGLAREVESCEAGFGPMLTEPDVERTIEVKGQRVYRSRPAARLKAGNSEPLPVPRLVKRFNARVTRLLEATAADDRQAAAEILPLVYDELRKLAAAKLAAESPGHTLDATALVHDAWLKLNGQSFTSRSSYLRAAGVAMRRLLVDHARAKNAAKRGSGGRVELSSDPAAPPDRDEDLDALDAALERLAVTQPRIVELVQLRYFVGLTIPAAAAVLDIAPRTADAWWAYARGWLAAELKK